MSHVPSGDAPFTRRFDRVAGLGCFTLAAVIAIGSLAGILDLLRGCSDRRHGCAYFIVSLPVALVVTALCIGAGWWLWPKDHDVRNTQTEPPNER